MISPMRYLGRQRRYVESFTSYIYIYHIIHYNTIRYNVQVLSCLSISIHAFLIINEYTVTNSRIFVHVNKTKPIIPLIDVKANYENKFIAIKGIVTRVSQITPLVCILLRYIYYEKLQLFEKYF